MSDQPDFGKASFHPSVPWQQLVQEYLANAKNPGRPPICVATPKPIQSLGSRAKIEMALRPVTLGMYGAMQPRSE